MTDSFSAVLDFETLDTAPTAVIIQIGCIIVRRTGDQAAIVNQLDLRPNILTQLADGRTHTRDTILWHQKGKTLPRETGEHSLPLCSRMLVNFLQNYELHRIWAWGKDFERPLLENICNRIPLPEYHFRKFSCARDHWQSAFGVDAKAPPRTHHALQDCKDELRDLIAALNHLNIFHAL